MLFALILPPSSAKHVRHPKLIAEEVDVIWSRHPPASGMESKSDVYLNSVLVKSVLKRGGGVLPLGVVY